MKSMRAFLCVLLTALVLACGVLPAPALASSTKEKVEYHLLRYMDNSPEVARVQVQLQKLYYFENSAPFNLGLFDEPTAAAWQLFCQDHNLMPSPEGITPEQQKFLLESDPTPRATATVPPPTATPSPEPTPGPTPFPNFRRGDGPSVTINTVQQRLSVLGYFEDVSGTYSPGMFDEVTEIGVRRFCETISAEYHPEIGLDESLYLRIVADDAPAYPKPMPTPFQLLPYGAQGEEVQEIQQRLRDLDYFRDYGEPEREYGPVTQQAVRRFCEVNGIPAHPNGMDSAFYNRLFSDSALPNPPLRTPIVKGDRGDRVEALQDRLYALDYYKDGKKTGVCDDAMLDAAERFAKFNDISIVDKNEISLRVQDAILDKDAKAYKETFVDWLKADMKFLGIAMPRFVMILVMVVILAGLIFLLIHTFAGKKDDPFSSDLPNPTPDFPATGGGRKLRLDISYMGRTESVTVSLEKPLRIGRREINLPLDKDDHEISRDHCQLYFNNGALLVRDYSRNGTSVNGHKYNNCEGVVNDGDRLQVGQHEITVHIQ